MDTDHLEVSQGKGRHEGRVEILCRDGLNGKTEIHFGAGVMDVEACIALAGGARGGVNGHVTYGAAAITGPSERPMTRERSLRFAGPAASDLSIREGWHFILKIYDWRSDVSRHF